MTFLLHFLAPLMLAAILLTATGCRSKTADQGQSEQTAVPAEETAEASAPPVAKPLGNLTSLEPAIAGLQSGMDTTSVVAILGNPLSSSSMPEIDKPGIALQSWYYRNLIVHYDFAEEVGAVEITGPGVRTSRGVAVGDSLAKVLSLYGRPARADGVLFHFQSPSDIENGDALVFRVQNAVVTSIYVGRVYE